MRWIVCACSLGWLAACGSGDQKQVPPGDGDTGGDPPASHATCVWNAGVVDPPRSVAPDPGEEGFLAAARLTPSAYPFAVQRLEYLLTHGVSGAVDCDATLPHRVEIYVDDAVVPPADATPAALAQIPAADSAEVVDVTRRVRVELDNPVLVNAGQHVFVAVELTGSHPGVMCISGNGVDAAEADRNYWSNAASQPYAWSQLAGFGINASLLIGVCGEAVTGD